MLKAVVFAVVFPLGICFAQADRAAVTGTISDQTHFAMASAHVSLVYPTTGLRRAANGANTSLYSPLNRAARFGGQVEVVSKSVFDARRFTDSGALPSFGFRTLPNFDHL